MEIDQIIAENLKKLRQQQNLSLSELAKRTGLSKVMLSQLEKGGSNPTINNIWKITNALGVPYTALLEEESDDVQVVHRDELLAQNSEDNHYRLLCYYPSSEKRNFEWFQMELDGQSSYTSVGHRNKGAEYIVVLSGVLKLETKGQQYELAAGDSINFQAASPHRYRNDGKEMVTAFIINYYPFRE